MRNLCARHAYVECGAAVLIFVPDLDFVVVFLVLVLKLVLLVCVLLLVLLVLVSGLDLTVVLVPARVYISAKYF